MRTSGSRDGTDTGTPSSVHNKISFSPPRMGIRIDDMQMSVLLQSSAGWESHRVNHNLEALQHQADQNRPARPTLWS